MQREPYLKMRVLERNASDGVNPVILIQFGSLYLTRLVPNELKPRPVTRPYFSVILFAPPLVTPIKIAS